MSTMTELRTRIARLFSDSLHRDVPSPDTDLFESGLLDSLSFVDLLVSLEREFDTTIGLDDLEVDNFRTIDRMAVFLVDRMDQAMPVRIVNISGRR
jgi:acyl carrier protein